MTPWPKGTLFEISIWRYLILMFRTTIFNAKKCTTIPHIKNGKYHIPLVIVLRLKHLITSYTRVEIILGTNINYYHNNCVFLENRDAFWYPRDIKCWFMKSCLFSKYHYIAYIFFKVRFPSPYCRGRNRRRSLVHCWTNKSHQFRSSILWFQ